LFEPDGPSFIQERDLRRRISGRSCLTECHCMSLPIVESHFAPRRFRMDASAVHIFAQEVVVDAALVRWQFEEIWNLLWLLWSIRDRGPLPSMSLELLESTMECRNDGILEISICCIMDRHGLSHLRIPGPVHPPGFLIAVTHRHTPPCS
jgi:hypothetical protein